MVTFFVLLACVFVSTEEVDYHKTGILSTPLYLWLFCHLGVYTDGAMPFEGVPQTEKVPSSMRMPMQRRGPPAEVKHPRTFEELAKESEARNRRATAVTEHSQASKAGEGWQGKGETERPISPFQQFKEDEEQRDIELTAKIRERFEREGYDRKAALGLTAQELQRLKKEEETKEQEEFDARVREKEATQMRERKAAEAAELEAREAKIAQVRARQAEGKRLMPPYSVDDQQAA